jgi:HD-GYP domain-containing protein (c-di-GMP phosphodiesterase class II)
MNRGTHFDPNLVDAFFTALPEVLEIRERFLDEPDVHGEPAVAAAQ